VLLCAITGSHHYGFTSPDSDIDIKGIHLAPTIDMLGMSLVEETHDRLAIYDGVECDLTTHEAAKALKLLLRGNGNILERLSSPYQLFETEQAEALQALVPAALSRRCARHYAGYFGGMKREHLVDGFRAKSLLYSYRVALTGVHLLGTGEVVAHLPTLADTYGFGELHDLVYRKTSTREKVELSEAESLHWRARWGDVEAMLTRATERSVLPVDPPNPEACETWLVEARLAQLH